MKSFVTGRVQKVSINNNDSKWKQVESGIPQGCVLRPMLFVIYINDLPDIFSSNAFLFADDTKIYRVITREDDHKELQKDLDILSDWSETWLLKFHSDKCKHMKIARNKKEENNPSYIYNYKEIQNTFEEAIIQINKFIVEINITNHMITPFIANTVFTKKKGIRKQEILLQTPWWASHRGGSMHQMGKANSTKNRCQLICIHERCHSPAASNMQNKKGNSWGGPLPQSAMKEGVENLLRVNWVWPRLSRPDRASLTGYA